MKASAMEILRQIRDLLDTAERDVGLSEPERRTLLRDIEEDVRYRIRREARIRRNR